MTLFYGLVAIMCFWALLNCITASLVELGWTAIVLGSIGGGASCGLWWEYNKK